METLFDARAWGLVFSRLDTFGNGLLNTLESAAVGLLISFVIGIIIGLCGTSGSKLLRTLSRIYVEFFQDTPLMLQMLFLYYILSYGGFWTDKSFIPGATQILIVGMVSLGLYHGAYLAEVLRAGITAIPAGQFEAAYSQGFGYIDVMKRIILPQTVKIILPPLVNQVVALIKNTSCLYIVGGADLIATTYNFVTGETTGGAYGPAYVLAGAFFFIVCCPLSTLSGKWEESLKKREQESEKRLHGIVDTEGGEAS